MEFGTVYSVFCLVTAIAAFSLGWVLVVHHKSNPASVPFGLILFCSGIFSFGYAQEIMRCTEGWIFFWTAIEYLGFAFLPSCWLWLAIVFTDYKPLKTKALRIFLVAIGVFFLIVVATNQYHHLYYTGIEIMDFGYITTGIISRGILYFAYSVWVVACLAISLFLYGSHFLKNDPSTKKSMAIMLVAMIVVILDYVIFTLGIIPGGLLTAPITLIISCVIFSYGIFGIGMLELSPIARELIFEAMQEGVIVTDIDQRIVDFNSTATHFLPALTKAGIGKGIDTLLTMPAANSSSSATVGNKPLIVRQDTNVEYYDIRQVAVMSKSDKKIGYTWFLKNITEQHNLFEQLQQYAEKDSLTNIWNRRKWIELAEQEIARANRYHRPFALMIIDIDDFKKVNDSLGHNIGDEVLTEFAHFLGSEIRDKDIFGRLGGEEFGLILLESGKEEASQIANRIRRNLASHTVRYGESMLTITLSAGVFVCENGMIPPLVETMKKADTAMYHAKYAGKNQVCVVVGSDAPVADTQDA